MVKTKYFRNISIANRCSPRRLSARAHAHHLKSRAAATVLRALFHCGTLFFVNGNQIVLVCVCTIDTYSSAILWRWKVLKKASKFPKLTVWVCLCARKTFDSVSVLRNGMWFCFCFCFENFARFGTKLRILRLLRW